MSLPGLVYQAGQALVFWAVHFLPADVRAEARTMAPGQEEKKDSLLQSGAGLPPPLFTTLDCARRDSDQVGQLILTQSQLCADSFEIDVGFVRHANILDWRSRHPGLLQEGPGTGIMLGIWSCVLVSLFLLLSDSTLTLPAAQVATQLPVTEYDQQPRLAPEREGQ